jgi:hypothetical protein
MLGKLKGRMLEIQKNCDAVLAVLQVRKTPSWPRSWANSSLL